jgi:hypothetical protein
MGRSILVFPCLMAGCVIFFWLQATVQMASVHGLALLLWLTSCLLTLREALALREEGVLHWDGQQWLRETAVGGKVGVSLVRLDFQHWLLLEFRAEAGRSVWLCPARKTAPLRWDALRRALYVGVSSVSGVGQAGRKASS